MRQSHLFTKTRKEAPKDEVSKNAELLIRAGYIYKEMAGVYSYLPLGLRVLNKINAIIREEMNNIGGVEVMLTALQDPELWKKTNRWDIDVWFKTQLQNGTELGLGLTHEEPFIQTLIDHVSSYKDLPVYPYQIQLKFRNETRAKSGIMRTREFLMKDLYSFSKDENEHNVFYEQSKKAYTNVFDRVGLGSLTYLTFASGGIFAEFSHEYQTLSDAGEDTIYIDEGKKIAINKEVLRDDVLEKLGVKRDDLVEKKAIEVGNIFTLGTRFSEPLGLTYMNEQGEAIPVFMGSYGIGPARLMGTVVEELSDENGIVWPKAIAPFAVHLIEVGGDKEEVRKACESLYNELTQKGVEVLYDDRDARPGAKFADSDLIGIPLRVVISEKTLSEGKVEVKERTKENATLVSKEQLFELI